MVQIEEIPTTTRTQDAVDQFNDMMQSMAKTREELVEEEAFDSSENPLAQAIEVALAQGRGWGPGEKEAYLERILADDFIPPLFANTVQEVKDSGLEEAFTTLIYEGEDAASLMVQFKEKGNKTFGDGKRNQVKNMQYFRDAINLYYEAYAWSKEVKATDAAAGTADEGGDDDKETKEVMNDETEDEEKSATPPDADDNSYTTAQLQTFQSILYSNIALCHLQLRNWGLCRDHARRALTLDATNQKARYRLAKALVELQDWEAAADAMGQDSSNDDSAMRKLRTSSAKQLRAARKLRQQRERARAERVHNVKTVFRHCKGSSIRLGRVPLVVDDEEDEDSDQQPWQHHLPHSGLLPSESSGNGGEWSWPCLFVYPSHNQSDLITSFGENEMLAARMVQVFPELDEENESTSMPWDRDNNFTCSQLAVYFQVHTTTGGDGDDDVHPDDIQLLPDQASCMRFYEASRALKGDEGSDVYQVVRTAQLQRRARQQAAWKRRHGSIWADRSSPPRVVRVHPAMTLRDILTDPRMIVPNFLVTLIFIPEEHPAHDAFLKENKCVGVLQQQ